MTNDQEMISESIWLSIHCGRQGMWGHSTREGSQAQGKHWKVLEASHQGQEEELGKPAHFWTQDLASDLGLYNNIQM